MDARQLALAVVNDRGTAAARALALAHYLGATADSQYGHELSGMAHWDNAVRLLLPVVSAELRKPIYEGFRPYPGLFWEAAAEVLEFEIGLALAVDKAD
jgi:hypothetical protein